MKELKILGIDLAKNIFHLHGVDERGQCVLRKRVSRGKPAETLVRLPQTVVAMEACSGAHYWARKFVKMGHDAKLIPPQYVRPYVKTNKNDYVDAEAIAEACGRAHMRFVPIKGVAQHDIQTVHRVRERLVRQRVCLANEIRGLLQEYGIVIPQGRTQVRKHLMVILEDTENELTSGSREIFGDLLGELKVLDEQIKRYDKRVCVISRNDEVCQRIEKIEGVGPTTSTIIVASVPDPLVFKNGRAFSAWLGLVPRHSGTGGKTHLGKISKRGNIYIRSLLIHGARSALLVEKNTRKSLWARKLLERKGTQKAAVALANKTARIIWALMAKKEEYNKDYRMAA
jgi:transposase